MIIYIMNNTKILLNMFYRICFVLYQNLQRIYDIVLGNYLINDKIEFYTNYNLKYLLSLLYYTRIQ